MMLKYSLAEEVAAAAVETAVADTLDAGIRTLDIAADKKTALNTAEFGDAVIERLYTQTPVLPEF